MPLTAQNLDAIGKEKPISLSGGISFNQIFYSTNGIQSRRNPYSYFASGNLNLSLYGWAIPLTFGIRNRKTSFTQPFNQYSLHPTYKWVTAHAGYTSMSFSPYTVNGHVFLGGGLDFSPPGKWKLSALYGRFLKAVKVDTARRSSLPAYERIGYGLKATFGNGRDFIDVILFHASDDPNSISHIPDSVELTPQENLVVSIGGGKTLFKHFQLKAEVSGSAMTKDTRSEKTANAPWLGRATLLYQPRLSSSYYNAYKASFNYESEGYIIGFAYEKIDPQYRTLGAYYFNNDLENITLNGTAGLLQGRMTIAASVGTQHDNLDKSKISTMRRLVGSFNLNYMPSQRLSLSASYSTFQTYTNIRSQFIAINQLTPFDNLDTLNFTQISKNASVSGMYTFPGNQNRRQTLNLQITLQDAADKQGELQLGSHSRFLNINTSYTINLVPANMSMSASFNGALNQGVFVETKVFGPSVAMTRAFLNRKLRASLSSAFNQTYNDRNKVNAVATCRAIGSISLRKKHQVNVSTVMVKRTSERGGKKSFRDFTATLGYTYSFANQ
jgi:hypothetical protein